MRRFVSSAAAATQGGRAKVILIGSGRMGHIRSSLLYANPRFELMGIVDVNFEAATDLANLYQTRAFDSLDTALSAQDDRMDGIVLSSPTYTHADIIDQSALKHGGISIFTEKPVDETGDKIEHLFSIAEQANMHLCCGFQRRFDTSYQAALQALAAGNETRVVSANLFFADHPVPPKEFLLSGGGNVIMDLAPHDVDFIMNVVLKGDQVVSVYATGTSSTTELEQAGVLDSATILLKFQKGATVTLFMSRSANYGYDQRCELFGDFGLISVQNESQNSTIVSNANGIHHSRLEHSFPERFNKAFGAELDAFYETIMLQKPWPVTAKECIEVQRVTDAASRSIELNQVVFL